MSNGNGNGNGKRLPNGQFPPGISGNPNGRPPHPTLAGMAAELKAVAELVGDATALKNPLTKKPFPRGTTYKTMLACMVWARALSGDRTCEKLAFHYIDGLPHQSIDVTANTPVTPPLTIDEIMELAAIRFRDGNGKGNGK